MSMITVREDFHALSTSITFCSLLGVSTMIAQTHPPHSLAAEIPLSLGRRRRDALVAVAIEERRRVGTILATGRRPLLEGKLGHSRPASEKGTSTAGWGGGRFVTYEAKNTTGTSS